jgi:hypothetical protein
MPDRDRTDQHERELDRQFRDNVAHIAAQLRDRGVNVHGDESPEELVTLLEYVERFEIAVQSRGGDLMVDEPPRGADAEPDDVHFVIPRRRGDDSVADYLARIDEATARVMDHPSRGSARPGSAADADLMSGGQEREPGFRERAAPDEPPSPRAG